MQSILSQSIITGQVIDGEFNDPLPFANVLITLSDGSNIGGTSTDFDGSYIFEVQPGIYFLEFSFVGYDTKKITEINVGENEEVIVNSILLPASNALEEVTVLPEYSFSVSGSFNPEMNFNSNFIGNEKSAFNSLGFDNGYFDRPLASNQPIPDVETFNLSQTNLTMFLTNMFQKTMSVSRFDSFLDFSIGATASNQYNISDEKTIGFIAALGYKRDYEYYEDFFNGTVEKENINRPLEPYGEQRGELGTVQNLASSLLGVSYKTRNSKYKLNLLALNSGESTAIKGVYKEFIENPYVGQADILTYTGCIVIKYYVKF